MQKFTVGDGGNIDGTAKDRVGLTAGTTLKAKYWNDNVFNLLEAVINAGYTLIDDDISQLTKAFRGGYNSSYVYNTASIASQSVDDIALGSDFVYYKCLANGTTGDNPVGSVTGNWSVYLDPNIAKSINAATSKTTPIGADKFGIYDSVTGLLKSVTYDNLTATQKTYFDTIYYAVGSGVSGVRQTVQSGSVDTSGFANFVSIGTGLNVNIAATTTPIVIHAAGGTISADRLGTISADKTLLLPASSTSYIYESVAPDGTCTSGSTTLDPIYQFGGTPAVTNGQFTYNISEGKGYLGNGTTAPQVWITFHSEAITNGTNVTSVITYALNGMYDSGWTATLPSTSIAISKNSNLGIKTSDMQFVIECTTADANYSIGDMLVVSPALVNPDANVGSLVSNRNTTVYNAYNSFFIFNKTTTVAITSASWKYKFIVKRGW